jgi:hypothetical protein
MFSDWLYATTGKTHRIAQDRLYELVFGGLVTLFGVDIDTARAVLSRDYVETGARGSPKFSRNRRQLPQRQPPQKVLLLHNDRRGIVGRSYPFLLLSRRSNK